MSESLTSTAAWQELTSLAQSMRGTTLTDLFDADPGRGRNLVVEAAGIRMDYSKQLVTTEALGLLSRLAQERGLVERLEDMFSGRKINSTEDRAVLHVALRAPRDAHIEVDGHDVVPDVHEVLDRMSTFADAVRSGQWLGYTGEPIRSVVNIGIGGSDLGPVMAHEALRHYSLRDLEFAFVSNVDGTDIAEALRELDPASTLFIVASKTFTTLETMTNAHAAKRWLLEGLGDEAAVSQHFVALSTNAEAVDEFGIDTDNMFGFWDWVGGRYSMDSAIGLSTMIAIGPHFFQEMLAGFHEMDEHVRSAPFKENLAVLNGLISVWNRDFLDLPTVAVLPYEQYLSRFPAYLQQLTMESNGKSVDLNGDPVTVQTGPVYWGEPGTNGQHSFYQLIHQGTQAVPCDFIAFAQPLNEVAAMDGTDQHDLLIANVLAQSAALAFGRTAQSVEADGTAPDLVAHKVMPGNRPSTVFLADILTPHTLGALVALYEHTVFTAGVIWGIDSFDQWGVELGKAMASRIAPLLDPEAGPSSEFDSSTNALADWYRQRRRTWAQSD